VYIAALHDTVVERNFYPKVGTSKGNISFAKAEALAEFGL
jgi:hypothetical protein